MSSPQRARSSGRSFRRSFPTALESIRFTPAAYRNPQQLPDGAVLVVGAGSSGVQIADELQQSGRQVYLAVGPHDRPPRSYRGRDFCWWLGVLGKWDAAAPPRGAEHVTIAVSGAHGGHTVDFRTLAASGITLLGLADSFDDGVMHFAPDLRVNIENGDANYLSHARRGRRLRRPKRSRPARGAAGPHPRPRPGLRDQPHPASSISPPPASPRSSGRRLRSRLRLAAGRRVRRERQAQITSAAYLPSPESISSDCPGCRDADRASSGACGMTPNTSPTTSRSSGATSPTTAQSVSTIGHAPK